MESFSVHNDMTALLDSSYAPFNLPWKKLAIGSCSPGGVQTSSTSTKTASDTAGVAAATNSSSSTSSPSPSSTKTSTAATPTSKKRRREKKRKGETSSKASRPVVGSGGKLTTSSPKEQKLQGQEAKTTSRENPPEEGSDLDDLAGILVGLSQPSKEEDEDPLAATAFFASQRKKRRRTSPEELDILENTFKVDPMPNQALRQQLAQQLGMTPRRVQIWFQNKRAKLKRSSPDLPGLVLNKKSDCGTKAPATAIPSSPASTNKTSAVTDAKRAVSDQHHGIKSETPLPNGGTVKQIAAVNGNRPQTPAMVLLPSGHVAHAMVPLRPCGPNGTGKPALSPLQPGPRPGGVSSPQVLLKQMPPLLRQGPPPNMPNGGSPLHQLQQPSSGTTRPPVINRPILSAPPHVSGGLIRPATVSNILPGVSSAGALSAPSTASTGAVKSSLSAATSAPSPNAAQAPTRSPGTQQTPVVMSSGIPAQLHPHLLLPVGHRHPQQPQTTS